MSDYKTLASRYSVEEGQAARGVDGFINFLKGAVDFPIGILTIGHGGSHDFELLEDDIGREIDYTRIELAQNDEKDSRGLRRIQNPFGDVMSKLADERRGKSPVRSLMVFDDNIKRTGISVISGLVWVLEGQVESGMYLQTFIGVIGDCLGAANIACIGTNDYPAKPPFGPKNFMQKNMPELYNELSCYSYRGREQATILGGSSTVPPNMLRLLEDSYGAPGFIVGREDSDKGQGSSTAVLERITERGWFALRVSNEDRNMINFARASARKLGKHCGQYPLTIAHTCQETDRYASAISLMASGGGRRDVRTAKVDPGKKPLRLDGEDGRFVVFPGRGELKSRLIDIMADSDYSIAGAAVLDISEGGITDIEYRKSFGRVIAEASDMLKRLTESEAVLAKVNIVLDYVESSGSWNQETNGFFNQMAGIAYGINKTPNPPLEFTHEWDALWARSRKLSDK